jgi:hypothetical protein
MSTNAPSPRVKVAAFLFVILTIALGLVVFDAVLAAFNPTGVNEGDDRLGWRLKKNVVYRRQKTALNGRKFDVTFTTDQNGVRTFGSNPDAPVKILILGDSYTGEPYASDEQMWYAEFVRRLAELTHRPQSDFHVVAAASGGYGTLQTMLRAEEVKDFYKPTLLVHQFCDNDFLNNSFDLEQKSVVLNQWMLRPYLASDRKTVVFHTGLLPSLYRYMLYRSALFGVFDRALQVSLSNRYGGFLMIPKEEPGAYAKTVRAITYDDKAVDLTRFLLRKIRDDFAGVPAIMVDCPIESTATNQVWVDAARAAGFTPIIAPSDALVEAKRRGEVDLFATDGAHLSDVGNAMMGRLLAEAVAPLGLVDNK